MPDNVIATENRTVCVVASRPAAVVVTELLPGMSGSASIRPQMAAEKGGEKTPPEQDRKESDQERRGPK